MTRDGKESALSRWSRRKLEAQQAVEPDAAPAAAAETSAAEELAKGKGIVETGIEEKPLLTDADMPDIESLSEESDFSCFMSEGVSDELRNLALRKLFHAPVFNIRDGLDEYDDDFTTFEKLGDIITSDMKHRMEIEQEKLREALAAEGEAGEKQADTVDAAEQDFDADAIEEIDDDLPSETLASADSGTDIPLDPIDTETSHERH